MGERAAARTNQALSKISGMYVGKNLGVSTAMAVKLERIFKPRQEGAQEMELEFREGALGLEIEWTAPPAAGFCERFHKWI